MKPEPPADLSGRLGAFLHRVTFSFWAVDRELLDWLRGADSEDL